MDASGAARAPEVGRLLADVARWARSRDGVHGVVLVGSYARGQATTSSDVDVVVVAADVLDLATDVAWFLRLRPDSELIRARAWGPLLERRFRLPSGLVVELGLVPPTWVHVPLDPGTRRVLGDGHRIVHDPHRVVRRAGEASRVTREDGSAPA